MTIETLKKNIFKYLSTDVPEVLAIKGAWGIGKTYFWKQMLHQANKNNQLKLNRYSYVSLFGINSLDTFKFQIYQNIVNKSDIERNADLDTFKQSSEKFRSFLGRKGIGLLSFLPQASDYANLIESLAYLSVTDTLVCIDDLERVGSDLEIRDVLGLISQLKEQKKCKVVILLNEGEEGLEDYVTYREKVVDFEFEYAPTARECVQIAFTENNEISEKLKDYAEQLNIRNIRILKKIEYLVKEALHFADTLEPEVRNQIIHSLTLFSNCHYNHGEEIPSLDYVTNMSYNLYGFEDDKDKNPEQLKWSKLLADYGYMETDELDLVLAESLQKGYFNELKLVEKLNLKNEQVLAIKADSSFSDAWGLYHNSFEDNETEVVNTLYESFVKNVKYISPTNLNGTVRLLRDLNRGDLATSVIDIYINERRDEVSLFNPDERHFFGENIDSEVLKRFNEQYINSATTDSLRDVVERLSHQTSWSSKDEIILISHEIEDYYNLFKAEKGKHLSSYVRACLQFDQFANPNEQQLEIANRARQALIRIGKECDINNRRVRKYGININ